MQMVREFIKTALEGDKEDVAGREQGLLFKTFRASRNTLELARPTAMARGTKWNVHIDEWLSPQQ
jgi:hypothetical protein